MSRAKTRRVRIAVVYWLDAHYAEADDGLPGLEQISAGILLQNDRRAVKLAMAVDWHGDGDGPRDVLTIPRGMVTRVEVLRTVTLPAPRVTEA